eukprot:6193396-Pleurochrysis_carterae.AAC.4
MHANSRKELRPEIHQWTASTIIQAKTLVYVSHQARHGRKSGYWLKSSVSIPVANLVLELSQTNDAKIRNQSHGQNVSASK